MKTMHSQSDRAALVARIRRMTPETAALWGRMNAPQVVVHMTDAIRMATGDLAVRAKKHPAGWPVLKQLLLYVVPMGKNLPTAKELTAREPGAFDEEVATLLAEIDRFAARADVPAWPSHPIFGPMSRDAWGVLGYKHTDHHLTQFGV